TAAFPNCRSICAIAVSSAFSRSGAAAIRLIPSVSEAPRLPPACEVLDLFRVVTSVTLDVSTDSRVATPVEKNRRCEAVDENPDGRSPTAPHRAPTRPRSALQPERLVDQPAAR